MPHEPAGPVHGKQRDDVAVVPRPPEPAQQPFPGLATDQHTGPSTAASMNSSTDDSSKEKGRQPVSTGSSSSQ
ncbi:hypothetical protein [Streptomyces sp. NPDC058623]|uniref:hypothetical protein n=1 Tax=Streptomyces sp. NPDC058623 TaxID=3346563 RepID=UPI00364634D8